MQPSGQDTLIAFLLSCGSTKIYRDILWARVRAKNRKLSHNAFRQQIYRLGKKELIQLGNDAVLINRGRLLKLYKNNRSVMKGIHPGKTGQVLVSFDIPESKKKVRDWLRNQLKYWDFEMIHKSLWVGNGPLPKEFTDRLNILDINKNVRIFNIRRL